MLIVIMGAEKHELVLLMGIQFTYLKYYCNRFAASRLVAQL